ncbi:oxidoreductase, 2OG-Fe(II) oxygenase family protein [Dictyocaulus viviparus]|uniref:hypoxia-inducible factor-proline dioxygenase n=1 Tax=Dictyocaulus viviparus TaxID=29172 RepID=A0A0D8YB61_DICVI|nr:oxidoreductase, 2OG-Fe(II) oxygenase family protein [Dictyocaulus viviparus]
MTKSEFRPQIIETESSGRDACNGTLGKCRKRPTPSNSIIFKDHMKNLVYNITLEGHQEMMKKRGLTLNIHQTLVLRLRYIAEYVIRSLNEFGWAVVDNFMGDGHCQFIQKEIRCLYQRGLFSAGQLMDDNNKDEYHVKDIRSDQIYWFDGVDPRASDAVTVRLLVSMIDSVVQHFKERLPPYDISGRSRAMIAIYPGNGTRYVKHVDNPVKDGRCITVIYYCNEDWDNITHGGTLRLYPESSVIPLDIDPKADRLVFFWSDRRNPHEVMPVFRPRFAITIWYMDREERQKAIELQAQKIVGTQTTHRGNETEMEAPETFLKLSDEKMRVFPSTSSEPSLTHLDATDHHVIASSYDSTIPSQNAGDDNIPSSFTKSTSILKASSLHYISNTKDDTLYQNSSSHPNFDI